MLPGGALTDSGEVSRGHVQVEEPHVWMWLEVLIEGQAGDLDDLIVPGHHPCGLDIDSTEDVPIHVEQAHSYILHSFRDESALSMS